jgi:signal transduction histidine kinase
VRIEVASSGDGPTDEEVARAFELLYRGEHAVTSAPGLGIGLAVARELAGAEGGTVTLERRGNTVVARVDLQQ